MKLLTDIRFLSLILYTILWQAQQDIVLEEYEQFDDYLEMVVQFGVSVYFTKIMSQSKG